MLGKRRGVGMLRISKTMAQPKHVVCPSCGFKNSIPLPNNRCVSCGAKIEDLKRVLSRQEELERRYQQEGFSTAWFAISFVIVSVLTAAIVMGLPMVIPVFDFEGSAGMLVTIPVWFLAGVLVDEAEVQKSVKEGRSGYAEMAHRPHNIPGAEVSNSASSQKAEAFEVFSKPGLRHQEARCKSVGADLQ